MRNHGSFPIGTDARDAAKAAVLGEDVARTVHVARQLDDLVPISESAVDHLFHRYQHVYGQVSRAAAASRSNTNVVM